MILNKEELLLINGGASLSGTLINSVSKMINTLLDLGRIIGSAINYKLNNKRCK